MPGEFQGLRTPWDRKESDRTEQLSLFTGLLSEYIKKAAGETGLEFRRNNGPEIARICFAKCTVQIEGFKANIFFLPV